MVILDATIGYAGHSKEIIKRIVPGGHLIGVDRDKAALEYSKSALSDFKDKVVFRHSNFSDLETVFEKDALINGAVFDLGVSLPQLKSETRGFSFMSKGPLDMRMDTTQQLKAFDLVNSLKEDELVSILREYGEERFARRIAANIVKNRKSAPIVDTEQLSRIITSSMPRSKSYRRLHPATKSFQALRIAVNNELESLQNVLRSMPAYLIPGARLCVMSFHSLEDRIVKRTFIDLQKKNIIKILTKKPLIPSERELAENTRSRSVKLRVAEKI